MDATACFLRVSMERAADFILIWSLGMDEESQSAEEQEI